MKYLNLTLCLQLMLWFSISSFSQIPGDVCSNPIPYPGDVANNICVTSYDFSEFSAFDGRIGTCGFADDVTAWFNFTAPVTTAVGDPLYLSFDNGEGSINNCRLGLQFYSTNCFTPISNCLRLDSGIIGGLTQGTDYLILMWDLLSGGFSCDFCLTIAQTPPPGNECDDAIPYTGDILNGTCMTDFDFTGYSGSITSPLISCTSIGDFSTWFHVTTPVITIIGDPIDLFFDNGDGQTNDCSLSAEFYALDCNTPVGNCFHANNSDVITGLAQGTDYVMLIDNHGGNITCDFCLTLPPPLPANNDCSGATPYPADIASGGCVSGFDFSDYTDSGLSPSPSCDGGSDPTAWFTFTAPITSFAGDVITLRWDDNNYSCYTGIEIYEPDCLTPVSSCLDNYNNFLPDLIQGNVYYAVVWVDTPLNSSCDFCLSIAPPPPPGSECFDPIPYPGDITNGICVTDFEVRDYFNSGESPVPDCVFFDGKTVWFTITTPVETAVGDAINIAFLAESRAIVAQFYSLDCTSAISNCVQYGDQLTGLQQGTDYLMAVSFSQEDLPYEFSNIDFCLTISTPPNPNDVCSDAIPYPGDVVNEICVNDYNFFVASDSDSNTPSCWGGNRPDVWFSWTAPIISAAGDPINLVFDNGEGQENTCFLGIEFYETDCSTPASNCLLHDSDIITGLIQGTDYMMVVFDRFPGGSVCDFCLRVAPPPTQGDECDDPIPYPGDITNSTCATAIDFSNYTYTNDSPSFLCALPYQTIWYTITTPVTTLAGDPLDLYFDAGSCDLSISIAYANCLGGPNNCTEGNGIITGLEQGTDYLFAINNSSTSSSEICDFCITLEENTCPIVSFSGLPDKTSSSLSIALTGSPAGGTFSGNGVFFNFFNPSISGLGLHNITYTYDDGNGCSGSDTQNILVYTINFAFVDYNLNTISPRIDIMTTHESLSLENVYPIPFRQMLNVDINSSENETVIVAIRTIEGKIVQQMEVPMLKGLNTITLDVDLLAAGNYYMIMQNQEHLIQIPILK